MCREVRGHPARTVLGICSTCMIQPLESSRLSKEWSDEWGAELGNFLPVKRSSNWTSRVSVVFRCFEGSMEVTEREISLS